MINLEDLMQESYTFNSERQQGLLSHLWCLSFLRDDEFHEGTITVDKTQAKALKTHCQQIIDCCSQIK